MSILNANNLSQQYGAFTVFSGITVNIPHGAKIGLVGANGIGKTTLLRIIAGLEDSSSGGVHIARGTRLGYLRQEAIEAFAQRDNSLIDEMLLVFAPLQAEEEALTALAHRLAAEPELLDEYGTRQEAFIQAGGYDYDLRIEQTLSGLGFSERHYDLPLTHLSGGQKTRALLAKLLLERPDLLILDEPTNHLDIETVAWLEKTLYKWDGALLIVSHDRYFLDHVVNTIWEMSRVGMEAYRGNYSAYVRQRQERWERRDKVYQEEVERLSKELDYVKKNIARASTNAQAVGRLRRLGRELTAIHELGLLAFKDAKNWMDTGIGNPGLLGVAEVEQMLKTMPSPNLRPPRLSVRIKAGERGGDLVLRTNGLKIGYANHPLFTGDNIALLRGECAALIGGNGTGKTTFLKTLTGELSPLAGKLQLGINIKPAYFSQAHEALNFENTVLDELIRHKPMKPGQARTVLGQYLFRSDEVFKPVGALSGGERGRLALAILAQQGANFLLLDEPTNHLDIQAQEILQEALEHFEGTILLVSHDRYLIAELATQIWQIEDGRMTVFNGTYAEFAA